MNNRLIDKISDLNKDILSTAKAGDFTAQVQKIKTQRALEEMLQRREDAQQNHQKFPATQLEDDVVYQAAKEAGDKDVIESIKDRELDKYEYISLSEKYGVNKDRQEDQSEIDFGNMVYAILLSKPNMTAVDKDNMGRSIEYLKQADMYTLENIKKLNAINYGLDYIEIGGVKFSRDKFIPQIEFNEEPNKCGVYKCNKARIFKSIYNGTEEYYLSSDRYIEEATSQGKKVITDSHIRKALQSLPGEFEENYYQRSKFHSYDGYRGGNILSNILNLSMSGSINCYGEWCGKDTFGFLGLCSVSPAEEYSEWSFDFNKDKCYFTCRSGKGPAYPCLYIVE